MVLKLKELLVFQNGKKLMLQFTKVHVFAGKTVFKNK